MIKRNLLKAVLTSAICLCFLFAKSQDGFVRLKGKSLVGSAGQPVTLHAVNLGGWLLWEGWMWGGGFTKESVIKQRLLDLLGHEAYINFIKRYYSNFISENDIALIAKHGFNSIRVPFNYRIFNPENEDSIDGSRIIDQLISWCKKYKLYVVLDMHAAPGGQNNLFISDPENVKLWDSEQNQQKTCQLWKQIAARYKNDTTVAGYDILNEPDTKNPSTLLQFYKELIASIRSVDSNHLLIIEGNKLAHNFDQFPPKLIDDQIYSYHYYPWFQENNKPKSLYKITSGIETDLPFWCGEWGEDTPGNLKEISSLLSAQPNLCGMAFWTWKRIYKNNNRYPLYSIASTSDWNRIVSWLSHGISKPSKEQAAKAIEEFLNAIEIDNCSFHE